jgi:hypothetical protein
MEWELEYLNKKMREKIKKVDKIVRHELDEEHNSDIDSIDMNYKENIIIDIPKSKPENELITIENNKQEKDILPVFSLLDNKKEIYNYINEFKDLYGRYPMETEVLDYFEKDYSISNSSKYDIVKLINEFGNIIQKDKTNELKKEIKTNDDKV